MPFRLLNLPSGAKLVLKTTKTKKAAEINVKIQFINSPFEKTSVVKAIGNQSTLEDLVKEIEKDLLSPILGTSKNLKFQGMTKVVTQEEFANVTLAHFGVGNNESIRLIFESSNIVRNSPAEPKKESPVPTQGDEPITEDQIESENTQEEPLPFQRSSSQNNSSIIVEDREEPEVPKLESNDKYVEEPYEPKDIKQHPAQLQEHSFSQAPIAPEEPEKHVYVYRPPEKPIVTYEPDEEEYDLTVSHARQYQSILSQRAHESYKTKRLRQEANKKRITNIEIRIRFPDDSSIQVNFNPEETNKDLYNLVSDTLVDPSIFVLSIPYPAKDISNDDTKLTDSFESRNLVLFKTKHNSSGPYLKDEYLNNARDLKEAEDVKLDLERQYMKDDIKEDLAHRSEIQNGQLPKKKDYSVHSDTSSSELKDGKKVPKWLKLGKK